MKVYYKDKDLITILAEWRRIAESRGEKRLGEVLGEAIAEIGRGWEKIDELEKEISSLSRDTIPIVRPPSETDCGVTVIYGDSVLGDGDVIASTLSDAVDKQLARRVNDY